MAILNFDARTVVPATGAQDPIPAGWYTAVLEKSELKPTANNPNNHRLSLGFTVIEGPRAGSKIFDGLNIRHDNAQTQEIAHKQLSALCHAVNVLTPGDSVQLHNIPLKIKVKLKPAVGQYDAGNEVTAYKSLTEWANSQAANAQGAASVAPVVNVFAPPPANNPLLPPSVQAQFATPPVAAPVYQPQALQAPAQPWQAPASAQPWTPPAAAPAAAPAPAYQAPVQQAPVQQAPVQYAPAPVQAPTQYAPPPQAAQPAWANATPQAAPVGAPQAAQVAQAPAGPPVAQVTPPWVTPAA